MMTKILSAAAVLAIAGSALAQGSAWNMRGTVNFDQAVGGNPPSAGIVPSTSFFQVAPPFGSSNGGVDPAFAGFVGPDLFLDSYWALSSGPSTADPAFQAGAYAGSAPGTISSPGFANGNAYNPAGFGVPGQGFNAVEREVNGVLGWAIFIARLTTIGEGSSLANDLDGGAVFGRVGVFNGGGVTNVLLTLNGAGVQGPGGLDGSEINTYWLVSEVTNTTLANGTAVTVHDLYFTTAIPTPGAVALFGLAGLAAARRRRA